MAYAGRQFDAIVVTHYLHRPLLPLLAAALAPGGLLIYETSWSATRDSPADQPAYCCDRANCSRPSARCSRCSPSRRAWSAAAAGASFPPVRGPRGGDAHCARCTPLNGRARAAGRIRAYPERGLHDQGLTGGDRLADARDGSLDFDAYRRLIEWHIAEGTNGIVSVAPPASRRRSTTRSTAS